MVDFDVIVIGAGHNGLVSAAYLAKAGRRVLVLEQRDAIGGAAVTEEIMPGFRISTVAAKIPSTPATPRPIIKRSRLGRREKMRTQKKSAQNVKKPPMRVRITRD